MKEVERGRALDDKVNKFCIINLPAIYSGRYVKWKG